MMTLWSDSYSVNNKENKWTAFQSDNMRRCKRCAFGSHLDWFVIQLKHMQMFLVQWCWYTAFCKKIILSAFRRLCVPRHIWEHSFVVLFFGGEWAESKINLPWGEMKRQNMNAARPGLIEVPHQSRYSRFQSVQYHNWQANWVFIDPANTANEWTCCLLCHSIIIIGSLFICHWDCGASLLVRLTTTLMRSAV